jgi:hypothetical protein
MQEHFWLEKTIMEEASSFMFNNVARKVIKDYFKHTHLQSITYFYTQVLK